MVKYIISENYDIILRGHSDCEIIGHLYLILGFYEMVKILDGYFSIVLVDLKQNNIYCARDRFGVRSFYYATSKTTSEICFASEAKCLNKFDSCEQFPPSFIWSLKDGFKRYYELKMCTFYHDGFAVRNYLIKAVQKRLVSDRPIGCLLSGGFDSSLIASILCTFMDPKKLKTFSIGLKNSDDLKHARIVADFLGTTHSEIIVTNEEMLKAIPETIRIIESYDTTSVRASTPMILLCKYIARCSDVKVIFSGEGADELSGSYKYFRFAENHLVFQKECLRLLNELHSYDLLRSDKSVSSAGLELRAPFMDNDFVEYYMSINPKLKMYTENRMEKYILRDVFRDLLPSEICWRSKEAFSDGVSDISSGNTWYKIIQNDIFEKFSNKYGTTDIQREKEYYKEIFLMHYPQRINLLKNYWEPKWTKIKDPSALLL